MASKKSIIKTEKSESFQEATATSLPVRLERLYVSWCIKIRAEIKEPDKQED